MARTSITNLSVEETMPCVDFAEPFKQQEHPEEPPQQQQDQDQQQQQQQQQQERHINRSNSAGSSDSRLSFVMPTQSNISNDDEDQQQVSTSEEEDEDDDESINSLEGFERHTTHKRMIKFSANTNANTSTTDSASYASSSNGSGSGSSSYNAAHAYTTSDSYDNDTQHTGASTDTSCSEGTDDTGTSSSSKKKKSKKSKKKKKHKKSSRKERSHGSSNSSLGSLGSGSSSRSHDSSSRSPRKSSSRKKSSSRRSTGTGTATGTATATATTNSTLRTIQSLHASHMPPSIPQRHQYSMDLYSQQHHQQHHHQQPWMTLDDSSIRSRSQRTCSTRYNSSATTMDDSSIRCGAGAISFINDSVRSISLRTALRDATAGPNADASIRSTRSGLTRSDSMPSLASFSVVSSHSTRTSSVRPFNGAVSGNSGHSNNNNNSNNSKQDLWDGYDDVSDDDEADEQQDDDYDPSTFPIIHSDPVSTSNHNPKITSHQVPIHRRMSAPLALSPGLNDLQFVEKNEVHPTFVIKTRSQEARWQTSGEGAAALKPSLSNIQPFRNSTTTSSLFTTKSRTSRMAQELGLSGPPMRRLSGGGTSNGSGSGNADTNSSTSSPSAAIATAANIVQHHPMNTNNHHAANIPGPPMRRSSLNGDSDRNDNSHVGTYDRAPIQATRSSNMFSSPPPMMADSPPSQPRKSSSRFSPVYGM